jgi:hypothetical protein
MHAARHRRRSHRAPVRSPSSASVRDRSATAKCW